MLSLTRYINSLSNADKKSYRVALDEFGKYIYKTNTRLSKQDLSRVNKLYDVINTNKFSADTVIKSKEAIRLAENRLSDFFIDCYLC